MIDTQRYSMSQLPCLKVVAYKDRAEVQRLVKTSLKRGETEITIDSLSASMDMNSIRVDVGYGSAIVIDVLTKEKMVDVDEAPQQPNELEAVCNDFYDCLELNRQLLNLNKIINFSQSLSKSVNGKNNHELRKIRHQIRLAEDKLKDSSSSFNKTVISEMKIKVGSSKDVDEVWFLVTYFVYNVSWSSKYDVRVFSGDSGKSSLIKTYCYGVVSNQTGEDWLDTRLSLSTSEPPVAGKMPQLVSQNLTAKKLIENKKISSSQTSVKHNDFYVRSIESRLNYLQSRNDLSNRPIVTFEIAKNANIKSHSQFNDVSDEMDEDDTNRVLIQQFDIRTEFEFETVPKKSLYVFRKAMLKNKSNNEMLAGQASVFLDNNFTSKCFMPYLAQNEEFQLDLGVEPSIQVEYRANKGVRSSAGFLSKRSRTTFEQVISVRNMSWTPVKLKIIDNLPLSNKKDGIKVKLVTPKMNNIGSAKNTGSISFDRSSHVIDVSSKMAPNERKEFLIKYSVDYPSKMELDFN